MCFCHAYRFQQLAVDIPEKNWNFPEFFDMHKFERFICEFGWACAADTVHDERSHKDQKALKNVSNNHADYLKQVSTCLCHYFLQSANLHCLPTNQQYMGAELQVGQALQVCARNTRVVCRTSWALQSCT